jgi:hypothetical protein
MKRLSLSLVLALSLFFVLAIFAQDTPTPADTSSPNAAENAAGAAAGILGATCGCVGTIIWLAVLVVTIIGLWKVFVKAGKPGWGAIVPIYNIILICEITGRPAWWVVLTLIPFVNFIVLIILFIDLAKAFGKSPGYGIGLAILPFIFFPMLGFGAAQYRGPVVATTVS